MCLIIYYFVFFPPKTKKIVRIWIHIRKVYSWRITSTWTESRDMLVISLTVSDEQVTSMILLWILIWNLSHVLVPSPHGDFLVVIWSFLVGNLTGPFTCNPFCVALYFKLLQAIYDFKTMKIWYYTFFKWIDFSRSQNNTNTNLFWFICCITFFTHSFLVEGSLNANNNLNKWMWILKPSVVNDYTLRPACSYKINKAWQVGHFLKKKSFDNQKHVSV